jgi:hypothetical protein
MSIQQAMRFLRDMEVSPSLRDTLYACQTQSEVWEQLACFGYGFTGGEFEEAVDHMHVACQSWNEADSFMNRVFWFRMLIANA